MRFNVLGPLQVVDGAGELRVVPAAKQRIMLAVLLLNSDRTVAPAELAEALWGTSPPPSAAAVMRTYVTRLRQALGPAGARIVTRPPGWTIDLHSAGELDLAEVNWLWRAARAADDGGDWRQVSSLLTRALSLWRGEPLADVPSAALTAREAGRLTELHLQLTEARIDAELRLGRHGELVAELRRLAAGHPFRERLRTQLMLASYRCGDQAAALEVYRDAQATLAEELGVEPGRELHEMHQRILAGDPELTAQVTATAGPAPARSDHSPQTGVAVPQQLPAAILPFTARAAELVKLTRLADQARAEDAVAILMISGMAGVGKSTLAVHWAHQMSGRFPDGQLYANLSGFAPSAELADPAAIVRGFLEALGVAAGQIPASPQAQVGLYRSLLAGKRVLVVLDNARDAAHVRPLLPGTPGSLVVVTSRNRLTGLSATDGGHLLLLDVLRSAEARELVAMRLGNQRVAAEPGAVGDLVQSCAGLPLALAITSARAAARPHHPLTALATELRDTGRLDALDDGDPASSVRAVFSWSYDQLSPAGARLFRLLSLHPGPDITTAAAASLAGAAPGAVRRQLAELTGAHLLTEHVPGRFACHDLLRAYAIEQAHAIDSHTERSAAAQRVLDHYLHTAAAASLLIHPGREPISLTPACPGVTREQLTSEQQALTWFDAEHRVLLAAVSLAAGTAFDVHAWQTAWTVFDFLDWRGHWQQGVSVLHTALAAATRLGDLAAQATVRRLLASAYARLEAYDEAAAHQEACLELCKRHRDPVGQARAHASLSFVADQQGRFTEALSHAEQALRIFEGTDRRGAQAEMLNAVGWCHVRLGNYERARSFCQEALALHGELGDRGREAHTWDTLGYAEHHLGHYKRAATCYTCAHSIFTELGDRYYQATILTHLGDTYHAAGQPQSAHDAWQQALAILEDMHHPDAGQVNAKLTNLNQEAFTAPD